MPNHHAVIDFVSGFVPVSDDEKQMMLERIHILTLARNEVIQKQGEIARRVLFILKGAVRTYYIDEKGHEHTVSFILENQPFVAFDSFANQTPSGIAAIALEPTEIIWTSHTEFFDFMERFPKYESAVRAILGQRLMLEGEHSKLLRINPARDRYEALCKARPDLIARIPLKYLASYIGMTLETLSRVRAGKL